MIYGDDMMTNTNTNPSQLADLRTADVHCQCGQLSDQAGSRCLWSGPRADTVVVETMPYSIRASHEAAGNRGSYPNNGAVRLRVEAECADRMVDSDSKWTSIVEDDSIEGDVFEEAYEASLQAALAWATDASDGDYLVQYEDTGLTDAQDPGSRCGYSDAELAEIEEALGRRDLRLVADDRGLGAQAVRS